ncbi:MAG: hypothetical protein M1564_00060 [Candidatus Marsarchaeota archaeon]|jgi:hypothetical protein|nr:hypothetical protein [Candidatus Marsarchaeota archaeon]MCL5430684.1 hypothetical protein [Candidatus Marsarchaeota archaeon]
MAAKSTKQGKIKLTPVKLLSQLDFARYVAEGYLQAAPVMLMKTASGRYSTMAYGESLKKSRITYYYESSEKPGMMLYRNSDGRERLEEAGEEGAAGDVNAVPISPIEVSPSAFSFTAKPEVITVKALDYKPMLKNIALRSSISDSGSEKVYSFIMDGERYIGSFTALPDDEQQTFMYSKIGSTKVFNFFRYNYTAGTVEETDTVRSSSDIYVRVINIAEPFPFKFD